MNSWNRIKGFSILEVMVGIFLFTMGMLSIYALIVSTYNMNAYNKNYIIATSLARQQLELIRNIRDSNYVYLKRYNQINPSLEYKKNASGEYPSIFETWKKYKIENDYSSTAKFPVSVSEISDFWEGESVLSTKMENYKLCLSLEGRYTYSCSVSAKRTPFYSYVAIDDVVYNWGGEDNAMKVKSKVIWYHKWYHEYEVETILADWKRL